MNQKKNDSLNESFTPHYPFGDGQLYPNSDLDIDGTKIEIYVSDSHIEQNLYNEFEKNLKLLHENIKLIKQNYFKAKNHFVEWYNNSDDGNVIQLSDLKKPYCIVYNGHSNMCEFDYKIIEDNHPTPYALEIKIDKNNVQYSCYPI